VLKKLGYADAGCYNSPCRLSRSRTTRWVQPHPQPDPFKKRLGNRPIVGLPS
jgi:hypothetical protein